MLLVTLRCIILSEKLSVGQTNIYFIYPDSGLDFYEIF